MIEVYTIHFDKKQGAELYSIMLNYVSKRRRELVSRYGQPIDAQRSLMGEILARLGICNRLHVTNDELNFRKNAFGKPMLSDAPDCHFNVSHSGEWVVCAFSESPIGVDIERIKPTDYSIAKRFFSCNEYNELMSRTGYDQLTYFYRLWTLKESYIKAVGKGLSISLNSFSFQIGNNNKVTAELKEGSSPAYFSQYLEDDAHVLSLCSFVDVTPRFRQLDCEELRTLLQLMKPYDSQCVKVITDVHGGLPLNKTVVSK